MIENVHPSERHRITRQLDFNRDFGAPRIHPGTSPEYEALQAIDRERRADARTVRAIMKAKG